MAEKDVVERQISYKVIISEAFLLLSRENGYRSFARAGVFIG